MKQEFRASLLGSILFLSGTGFSGCATVSGPSNPKLAPQREAAVQRICMETMKLMPGSAPFQGCMEVLTDIAHGADKAREKP